MKILLFVFSALVLIALVQVAYADFDIGNFISQTGILNEFKGDRLSIDKTSSSLSITDEMGITTTFTFDNSGNVVKVKVPGQGVFTFGYNAAGKVTEITSPLGHKLSYEYDSNNNVIKVREARGKETGIEYDSQGRIVRINYPSTLSVQWGYDDQNRVISIVDQAMGSEFSITYNSVGEVDSLKDSFGNYSLEHDSDGRVVKIGNSLVVPGSFKIPSPKVFDEATDARTSIIDTYTPDPVHPGFGGTIMSFPKYFKPLYLKPILDPNSQTEPFKAEFIRPPPSTTESTEPSDTILDLLKFPDGTLIRIYRDALGRPIKGDLLPPVFDRRGFPADPANIIGYGYDSEGRIFSPSQLGTVLWLIMGFKLTSLTGETTVSIPSNSFVDISETPQGTTQSTPTSTSKILPSESASPTSKILPSSTASPTHSSQILPSGSAIPTSQILPSSSTPTTSPTASLQTTPTSTTSPSPTVSSSSTTSPSPTPTTTSCERTYSLSGSFNVPEGTETIILGETKTFSLQSYQDKYYVFTMPSTSSYTSTLTLVGGGSITANADHFEKYNLLTKSESFTSPWTTRKTTFSGGPIMACGDQQQVLIRVGGSVNTESLSIAINSGSG